MSPVDYTIFSRADDPGGSVTTYYVMNFLIWAMLAYGLSFWGICMFYVGMPTWEMHKRRLAVLEYLKPHLGNA